MATHSSLLAQRIPWTEEPGGCSPRGCKELDTTEHAHLGLEALVLEGSVECSSVGAHVHRCQGSDGEVCCEGTLG